MANRYVKRSSASLVLREIQVKTTVRTHLTLTRMALIEETRNNRCWQQVEKRDPRALLVGR